MAILIVICLYFSIGTFSVFDGMMVYFLVFILIFERLCVVLVI